MMHLICKLVLHPKIACAVVPLSQIMATEGCGAVNIGTALMVDPMRLRVVMVSTSSEILMLFLGAIMMYHVVLRNPSSSCMRVLVMKA